MKKVGYYLLVKWTDKAKRFIVGGDSNKRIFHMVDGYVVGQETYNPIKFNSYKRKGMIIRDLTRGQSIPEDAFNQRIVDQTMSAMEIGRRTS